MAKASRSAYTSFAAEDSIYLEVSEESSDSGGSDNVAVSTSGSASNGSSSESGGGVKFKVSQVTTSFPVNGIPQATVMLAISTREPGFRLQTWTGWPGKGSALPTDTLPTRSVRPLATVC